jgi:signal transduction histidine kinase
LKLGFRFVIINKLKENEKVWPYIGFFRKSFIFEKSYRLNEAAIYKTSMNGKQNLENCRPNISLLESELVEVQRVLMEAHETDRFKLAQFLHDGPVQELYGLSFLLKALSDDCSPTVRARIEEFQTGLQNVVHQLMDVCGELRPPTLGPFGLVKTIQSHAENFQALHPELQVGVELTFDGDLPENIRIAFFRIYQEAMLNVLKHAHARHLIVRFGKTAEQVFLEIQDDGVGFQVPEDWVQMVHQGCLGIADSIERAFSIGARLQITSTPGLGTGLRVEIPCTKIHMGEIKQAQKPLFISANQMP